MSYIIAFVSFEAGSNEYPVQCFSTDLQKGDEVVVRRGDGKIQLATIQHTKYLNWDCSWRIECKAEEAARNSEGKIILPKGSPLVHGISTVNVFLKELRIGGWVPIKTRRRQYRAVLGSANCSSLAYIFVRKNGIDIQVLPRVDEEPLRPYSLHDKSLNDGKVVQHFFAHTTFNLLEGILRFSRSFNTDEKDLDRYFVPQGLKDKRTDRLKKQASDKGDTEYGLRDIYDACSSGDGGPAYMGDGVWITPDGDLHDWGR